MTARWWPRLAKNSQTVEEAAELLDRLRCSDYAHDPTRTLPYGAADALLEIALALACSPGLLCSTSRRPEFPKGGGRVYATLAELPSTVAVLLIEHDMDLVFRFARRITVLVAGSILVEGSPELISSYLPGCEKSIWVRSRMSDLLRIERSVRRLWRCGRPFRSVFPWRRGTVAVLGRNGMGKTTLMATFMGATRSIAVRYGFGGSRDHSIGELSAGGRGAWLGSPGTRYFPFPHGEENITAVARAGPLDAVERVLIFPATGRSAAQPRLANFGWGAADARYRAGPSAQPRLPSVTRRAPRGVGADRRPGTLPAIGR